MTVHEDNIYIYIVDPSPVFQIGLQAMLESTGRRIITFLSLPEELSTVTESPHKGIVIAGPNLGGIAPFQLCQKINLANGSNRTKFSVVIVSGDHQYDDHYLIDAIHAGASACLLVCFPLRNLPGQMRQEERKEV